MDVIGYISDGATFCDECGNKGMCPAFIENENEVVGWMCERCQAYYVDGKGWLPHEEATGPNVHWSECGECGFKRPYWEPESEVRSLAAQGALPCDYCGGPTKF